MSRLVFLIFLIGGIVLALAGSAASSGLADRIAGTPGAARGGSSTGPPAGEASPSVPPASPDGAEFRPVTLPPPGPGESDAIVLFTADVGGTLQPCG